MYVYPNITLAHVGYFNYIGNFQELINSQMAAQNAAQNASGNVAESFVSGDDKLINNSVIIEEDEEQGEDGDGDIGIKMEDTD